MEARLAVPPLPPAAAYLWSWLLDLVSGCAPGPNGRTPISYGEIADWARLTGNRPAPWETALLRELDALQRRIVAEG